MKHNFKDLTGQQFGRLTAIRYLGECKWECFCSCNPDALKVIRTEHLKNPKGTRSCGCLVREVNSRVQRELHITHGMHKTPEYNIWHAMHQRCGNPNNQGWKDYGGRGVRVCPEWNEFEQFYSDMGARPSSKHSIDRKDNGLLYSKATCRWATDVEQHNNTRRNRHVTHEGVTKTVAEWARAMEINYSTLTTRLVRGWSVEDSLTTPANG